MWLQNRQEVIDRILAEVDAAEVKLPAMVVPAEVSAPEREVASGTDPADPAHGGEPAQAPPTAPDAERESLPALEPESQLRSELDLGLQVQRELDLAPASAPGTTEAQVSAVVSVVEASSSEVAVGDPGRGVRSHEFVPAHTEVLGDRSVLDTLSDRRSASLVKQQIRDVIEAEGPVELGRLIRIVARRFDLATVRAARQEEIARLVPARALKKSRTLGTFAWPDDVGPETWTGYRVLGDRALDEVAPQEIANAMRAALSKEPGLQAEALIRATMQVFGISRLGANVRSRLAAVAEKVSQDADV